VAPKILPHKLTILQPDVRESILGFPALEGAKCVHFELGVLPLLPWKIGLESLLQLVHAPIKLLSSTDQELKRDAEFSEDLFAGLQASAAAGAESPKELGPAEKQHYLDLVVKRQPGRMISIDRQMLEKTGGETEMDVLLSVLLAKLIDVRR
jgi:hypothetical protein